MAQTLRIATLLVAITTLLTACASSAAQATAPSPVALPTAAATAAPTAAPTSAPQPTAIPTLAKDVQVAGVDVGGLTEADARQKLEQALQPLLLPLEIVAGDARLALAPGDIGLELPIADMLAEAGAAQPGAQVELKIAYDAAKLRAQLDRLSQDLGAQAPAISVLGSTSPISRSFALAGGDSLDLDAAAGQIDERLHALGGARRVTLALGSAARPTPDQLQEQVAQMAKAWGGVAGVYVYDLAGGQEIASVNKSTVFSAASTIKVGILLNAYAHVDSFTAKQEQALKRMIVDSDNIAANTILAASVGGAGTEDALRGAEQMSAMMSGLGLTHTYLYVPFEATEYLAQRKLKYKLGPKRDGEPPYTDSGRALRTTPAEMAQIYLMIDQCAGGKGVLLDKFADHLSAKRCQEMLDRLQKNGDAKRMRGGLPADVRVEHKSGWIDDMQADAGIVRSPGGDFLIAIYLYKASSTPLPDKAFLPTLAGFARLVYSYYNPVPLKQ